MVRDTAATRLTLGTLLVGAFALAVIDTHSGSQSSPLHPVRSVAATALRPLQAGFSTAADPLVHLSHAVAGTDGDRRRIEELTTRNVALQTQLRDALARAADVRSGTAVSATAATTNTHLTASHVIAMNAVDGYSWTVLLDKGSADGVASDSAVLDEMGLIGRVLDTTDHTSTVLLIADPISTVGVRMAGSGEIGSLDGTGSDLLRLTLFNPHARITPGERLLTFGSPGARPYPAAVPVGEVVAVTNRGGGAPPVATVRPYARLSALDVVGIVTAPTG